MPMVNASNWLITPLPSISPAGKATVVIVRVVPFVSVMEPWALRNPLAVAVIV